MFTLIETSRARKVTGGYDDFIGAKGGATYEHQVCVAGSTLPEDCSNTTTTAF